MSSTHSRRRKSNAVIPSPAPAAISSPEVVLLAVTGMSPAILTETIWALAQEPEPVIPTRVLAVTTTPGRRLIEQQLLGSNPRFAGRSPWQALRDALAAQGHDLTGRLRFGPTSDDVRVITAVHPQTGETRELDDLRHPADNEAAADFLLSHVRAQVENPDTHLIASLAGGRKTMGALLYACLSLVGRETDRLTHVLVTEPFESLKDFWFPSQPGGPLVDREDKPHNPSAARIELADIPFVALRVLFHKEFGRSAGSFRRLVDRCRDQVSRTAGEQVRLQIDRTRCEIDVNGTRLAPAPREHIILLFLADRCKNGGEPIASYQEAVEPLDQFRKDLRASAPKAALADWRHGVSLENRFQEEQEIRRAISSLRKKLREAGGNAPDLIPCLPGRGRFSLSVPPSLIQLK